ncbi:TPA: CDP-glycerol glycerophosphotransferase family protein, partial [Streptococcus pneumoniae]|nr:CDP-glycerol glycerophosphotransferase family protein [Streptococcus pneumoniae]
LDDMCNFINEITHNVDKFKEERRGFNEKVNKYRDGNNSKRLLEKIGIN